MTNKKLVNQLLEIAYQLGIVFIPILLGGGAAILGRSAFGITFANLKSLINSGALIGNPQFYISRILSLAFPFINKIKGFSPVLQKAIAGIDKAGNLLGKVNRLFMLDFQTRFNNHEYRGIGEETPIIRKTLEQIKAENNIADATGQPVADLKFIQKPNTKNPDSWILELVFNEQLRIGNKNYGQLIVNYCSNNSRRIGKKFVKKPGAEIIFGRTSQGKIRASDLTSKEQNYYVKEVQKNDDWHIVSAVFNDCELHADYLPFLRARSWGGYYMRRGMTIDPGMTFGKSATPFLLFGSARRFKSRLQTLAKNAENLVTNPLGVAQRRAEKLGIQKLKKLKLGGVGLKLAKSRGVFTNPGKNLTRLIAKRYIKKRK